MKEFFTAIFYIVVTIGVFILTYYSTKILSRRSSATMRTKNLQLLDKIPLGKDKQAAIMRVGEDYYLVGISNQSISFSEPLSKEAASKLVLEEPSPVKYNPFTKKTNEGSVEDKGADTRATPQFGLTGSSFMQYLTYKIADFLAGMIEKWKGRTHESKKPKFTDFTK